MGDINNFKRNPQIKNLPNTFVVGNSLQGFVFINYNSTKYFYYWPGSGNFRRNTYDNNIDIDAGFGVYNIHSNSVAWLHWNNCIITGNRTSGRIFMENIARTVKLNFNFDYTLSPSSALAGGSQVRGMAIYNQKFYIMHCNPTNHNVILINSINLKATDALNT
jgi:hypothetical protein